MKILHVLSWLLFAAALPVLAQPVQVSEAEFDALAAGKPRVVEDFNRFPGGEPPSPVALLNGQFSGTPSMGAPWCLSSQCLTLNLQTGVFTNLPAGTELWSARLFPAGSSSNVYDFDVVGGGGTQRITLTNIGFSPQGAFVGFQDPQGIRQVTVSLRTGGLGLNYSLDDVTTVSGVPAHHSVPAGGRISFFLLSGFLLASGMWLRRRA